MSSEKPQEPLAQRPAYEYARNAFEAYVQLASIVSGSIHHQSVGVREFWASVLFAKLCVTGVSMVRLLPGSRMFPSEFDHWDAASLSTLSRNLIENYHTYFYLCTEKVPDDEWQCRLQIFNLHDCITRKRVMTEFGITEDLPKFEQQADDLRNILKQNNFFLSLSDPEQKKLLKGEQAFYLSRVAIEQRIAQGNSDINGMYRLLSVQVHTLPMSFYRTVEQGRGTGVETDTELHYLSMAIEYAIPYLQLATSELIGLYPGTRDKLNARQLALLDKPFLNFDDLS